MATPSLGRILVVDDNADFRDLIAHALTQEGYEVVLACDGRQGVDEQAKRPSDLVITDIFMPEQDGFEVIGHFKKAFPATPIIVMSGKEPVGPPGARIDYLMAAGRFGAGRVLRKPFLVDELLAMVREVMGPGVRSAPAVDGRALL
jgi:CheY-like chemotaxis protein